MLARLERAFETARSEDRLAFVPYVMAADPDLSTTDAILTALSGAGADCIELGIPYSDPLADGPTVAAAGMRALREPISIGDILALVRRGGDRYAPIVLFTYFNPIYQFGVERFAREAADAGVTAAIVPDVALEETQELAAALHAHGVGMPLLIAPSTPDERAHRIAQASTGFIYVVSRLGVTGANSAPDFEPLRRQLAALRAVTSKPLAVGFGLSCPADVRAIAGSADAVVVGSALIDAYAGTEGEQAASRARAFVEPLIAAARATA